MIKFSKEKVLLLHRLIAEETGGSITPEELAEYLNVSVDEIRDIMRLAGDDGQENNNCLF